MQAALARMAENAEAVRHHALTGPRSSSLRAKRGNLAMMRTGNHLGNRQNQDLRDFMISRIRRSPSWKGSNPDNP